jgi:hypothetical protein
MKKVIHSVIFSSLIFAGNSIAGELGVTNSYGNSFREGTGMTNIQFQTNSQTTENSSYGAVKFEKSSYGGGSFETPSSNAPGNPNNNGGNQGGNDSLFSDNAFSASFGFGERNYTETTNVTGTTTDNYSFGSTNFTHSVGVFSR